MVYGVLNDPWISRFLIWFYYSIKDIIQKFLQTMRSIIANYPVKSTPKQYVEKIFEIKNFVV